MVMATLAATPAWGHVTVHPGSLPAGSSDVELTFRVPNERDNASTVTLQVFFPTNLPLLTVDVLPIAGWTSSVHTQHLSTPVQTDDGPVSEVVSDVTWTATAGGIASGQYEDFSVAAGSIPKRAAQLVFKALQTYSSGEVVRWIEVPTAGGPPPDFPAPVLTLTPASSSLASGTEASGGQVDAASGGLSSAEVLGIIALVVSAMNAVGLVWVLRRRREGTSSHPPSSPEVPAGRAE
jgi:uncharacterized protein YcnI